MINNLMNLLQDSANLIPGKLYAFFLEHSQVWAHPTEQVSIGAIEKGESFIFLENLGYKPEQGITLKIIFKDKIGWIDIYNAHKLDNVLECRNLLRKFIKEIK